MSLYFKESNTQCTQRVVKKVGLSTNFGSLYLGHFLPDLDNSPLIRFLLSCRKRNKSGNCVFRILKKSPEVSISIFSREKPQARACNCWRVRGQTRANGLQDHARPNLPDHAFAQLLPGLSIRWRSVSHLLMISVSRRAESCFSCLRFGLFWVRLICRWLTDRHRMPRL